MISEKPDKAKFASYLLKYGVPLVISVGLCWLLFRGDDIDLSEMWQTVKRECDFRWMVANIALGLMAQVFRAFRWRIQLRALDIRPSLWQLILSIFGTYSVNLVFPRLGEVSPPERRLLLPRCSARWWPTGLPTLSRCYF